jgi:ABC-type siderophore export system fused ATPase/permease subunit
MHAIARRHQQTEQHPSTRGRWDSRLEIIIAVALGFAAIVTAGSVYLNEKQEHKATVDFHQATHLLVQASDFGLRTPRGRQVDAAADRELEHAEDQQEKATRYTLVEVILASSLFLLGVAGVASQTRIKLGALTAAAITFVSALVFLATA